MSDELKQHIRSRYGAAARAAAGTVEVGSRASCCGDSQTNEITSDLYGIEEVGELPRTAVLASLGCGNPTALAELHPGETVLDLGSGGGIDVLLSARRVGPTGRAIGLDMTDEMLELARANRQQAGVANTTFLKGDIEAIPLPDGEVDVIISNCVVNLAADKDQVFREAYRVLKPGGRLAISDIVFQGDISRVPDEVRRSLDAWAGCVAGALEEQDYIGRLRSAGFEDVSIEVTRRYTGGDCCTPAGLDGVQLVSGFVRARKPA